MHKLILLALACLLALSVNARKASRGNLPVLASSALKKDKIAPSKLDSDEKASSSKPGLFSDFKFKGFSLSMQKTLTDWTSMAIGVKIPITPNFPHYESKIFLPRVTAFVGAAVPSSIKLSMTMSMPTQAILALALYALHKKDTPFVWPTVKPTDHVKRLGLSVSCKLGGKGGLKPTVGGVFMFLPGLHVVHHMLPMIILAPALVLTASQVVLKAVSVLEYAVTLVAIILREFIRVLARHADTSGTPSVPYFLHPFSPLQGWRAVAKYLDSKSSVFTFNFGYNKCLQQCGTSTSSALQYDLQPFFGASKKKSV